MRDLVAGMTGKRLMYAELVKQIPSPFSYEKRPLCEDAEGPLFWALH